MEVHVPLLGLPIIRRKNKLAMLSKNSESTRPRRSLQTLAPPARMRLVTRLARSGVAVTAAFSPAATTPFRNWFLSVSTRCKLLRRKNVGHLTRGGREWSWAKEQLFLRSKNSMPRRRAGLISLAKSAATESQRTIIILRSPIPMAAVLGAQWNKP